LYFFVSEKPKMSAKKIILFTNVAALSHNVQAVYDGWAEGLRGNVQTEGLRVAQ
jgi:hypothetical protein